jgi:hypothetical protein
MCVAMAKVRCAHANNSPEPALTSLHQADKQKNRDEGFQRSSRQDHPIRGKKIEWCPVAKKKQPTRWDGV